MIISQITDFVSLPDRDPAVGAKLAKRVCARDRGLIKMALRAAGVVGPLPKLKVDCIELLTKLLTTTDQ